MANIFEVPQPDNDLLEKAEKVRLASIKISQTENQNRIKALNFMADYLEKNSKEILDKSFKPKLIINMNDEDAINYLSSLKQIGRWSAEMILLFTYNRSNIWPIQDIGLLRAISKNYKKKYLPPEKFVSLLKKRFNVVQNVLKLKEKKSEIIDRKRINVILNNIKKKSKKNKIDTRITLKVWKSMINAFIQYEFRNFKKKR